MFWGQDGGSKKPRMTSDMPENRQHWDWDMMVNTGPRDVEMVSKGEKDEQTRTEVR